MRPGEIRLAIGLGALKFCTESREKRNMMKTKDWETRAYRMKKQE